MAHFLQFLNLLMIYTHKKKKTQNKFNKMTTNGDKSLKKSKIYGGDLIGTVTKVTLCT